VIGTPPGDWFPKEATVSYPPTTPTAAARRGPDVRRAGWSRRLLADVVFVAKRDRIWWLTPLIAVILLLAAFIVLGASLGPLAPFIYPLF
jgi:hypothetical protein